jgi:hypothetical protein
MDKQLLIDYLETLDSPDKIPHLPEAMLGIIGEKYNEAYKRIVGKRALGMTYAQTPPKEHTIQSVRS